LAIITITSDFGTKDYLAGACKGILLSTMPQATLCEITHQIEPYNFAEAAYIIANGTRHFPENSFHLLLFNLFDKPDSRPLIAWHMGHYYLTSDNGLLPMVLSGQPEKALLLATPPPEQRYHLTAWVKLFAAAIKAIETGLPWYNLGEEVDNLQEKTALQPIYGDDYLEGRILFIDRFENVVVNITRHDFMRVGKGRPFVIMVSVNDTIQKIQGGYPQTGEGRLLAFFNSAGYLELAINKGNAAGLLGLQAFNHLTNPDLMKQRMFYQTIRIIFTNS
jgi:S-adenosylmethionine hydrolase